MLEHQDGLSTADSQIISVRIREEMARRRISRQHVADLAKLSLSTLEKVLSGRRPFTLATLVRLEQVLGVQLRIQPVPALGVDPDLARAAPIELGSYARRSVEWLIGSYITLRPSYSKKDAVYCYKTSVVWSELSSCLAFHESDRKDSEFTQSGFVSVSNISGHIYFVTNHNGQFRLVIASRPIIKGEMFGIIASLLSGRGIQLTPIAAPIVYVPIRQQTDIPFGVVEAGHADYAEFRALLDRVEQDGFAHFISPVP